MHVRSYGVTQAELRAERKGRRENMRANVGGVTDCTTQVLMKSIDLVPAGTSKPKD